MPAGNLELEAAIDRLYQLPIAEFTEARNALAAERKATGDKDGAARVKALGKPTAVAWVVNLLYWKHRELFDGLADAMIAVASAQREATSGSGAAELRDATRRRAEQLQQLVRVAERRLLDGGSQATPAVLQRVGATLEAAASPRAAGTRDEAARGRLVGELRPAGFDLALGLGALDLPPPAPARTSPPESEAAPAPPRPSADDREAHAARLALQRAEFEVARLRRETQLLERSLQEAESRTAAARADVEQLEARLGQTRARADEKAAAESDARRALEGARAALAAAESALEALPRPRSAGHAREGP